MTRVCLPHRIDATGIPSSAVVSEQPQPPEAPSSHAFADPPSSQDPAYFTLLDIGSSAVRAAILTIDEGKATILGKGQYPQYAAEIKAGAIVDIATVIANSNEALLQAEQAAGGIIAPTALIALANPWIHGMSVTVTTTRKHPHQSITREELSQVLKGAAQQCIKETRKRLGTEAFRVTNLAATSL